MLHWTNKLLSYGGRLLLIKSVILSMTNFWCSAFKLPQKCLKTIESLCSAFLWTGNPLDTNRSKVSWNDVCTPTNEGGLGIRRLKDTSRVFCLKLIWRLLSNNNSLWSIWTREYLLRYSCFWDIKSTNKGSWQWRKLLSYREQAFQFIKMEVHNGKDTYFWFDTWVHNRHLLQEIPQHIRHNLGIRRNAKVADALVDGEWCFRRVRNRMLIDLIEEIKELPRCNTRNDITLWKHRGDEFKTSFSSFHTWQNIRQHRAQVTWSKLIWFTHSIPRYTFIAWLAVLDRLPTGSRAAVWGGYHPCLFCGDVNETRGHLFFGCPFSFSIWYELGRPIIGPTISPDWQYTLDSLLKNRKSKDTNILIRMLFQTTIYHIWKERNARVHHKPTADIAATTRNIARSIELRLRADKQPSTRDTLLNMWVNSRHGI